jgi:hypothetical protein
MSRRAPGRDGRLPAKLPITHDLTYGVYFVCARNAKATQLPLDTVVITGGTRHPGGIEISWVTRPDAKIDITYGNLAEGCHIFFYAAAAKG